MDEKERQRRDRLLRQVLRLMQAPVNDAVKLAYLQSEEIGQIDGLDLTALKEFKRSASGVVELKFIDRLEVARQLLEQASGETPGDPAAAFFQLAQEEKQCGFPKNSGEC